MERRQDYGNNADAFFDSLSIRIAPLARELRGIIRKAIPKASESIKWGMPVYDADGIICAILAADEYVALQFYTSGTVLHDPHGLLEGTGKRMRHVKIWSKSDIKKQLFIAWIMQAAHKS
jgi:hypothetical protein